ncbi:hypothetical protein HFX_0472 [Haloferax mediterranei ATCC 33500]|uniref:Uncharacterized protein n=1 Tax=Haloferax mediterranei (strain ATCC 33500 / DSM 1411 / JCM 8866 / NBRC 14739 / NCIMB 2177 / R-4) TaxID=523841 RepID=I3R1U6_HALMT|nr:hypothetical protein HFX_0472 [Haloferax mediterranei ATCC 33500]
MPPFSLYSTTYVVSTSNLMARPSPLAGHAVRSLLEGLSLHFVVLVLFSVSVAEPESKIATPEGVT